MGYSIISIADCDHTRTNFLVVQHSHFRSEIVENLLQEILQFLLILGQERCQIFL